ncbi:MAG TPA: hypothetical protein EYG85_05940 [Crocinitomix sp.]|nr:hypothetical protein [Crocinitomix sp.]
MKSFILLSITFLLLTTCVEHHQESSTKVDIFEKIQDIDIKYAKRFSVDTTHKAYTKIEINSGDSKYKFYDSIFIPHSSNYNFNNHKVIYNNYKNIAIQSVTYFAYLEAIDMTSSIKGLSGFDYMSKNDIKKVLRKNKVIEISNEGEILMEKLLKINPDLFLIYPYELETASKYKRNGIQTLLVAEYLESTPLGRLEWIKFFGLVFNNYHKANAIFNQKEKSYLKLKQAYDSTKTLFFNLPFNDNWAMPSTNSVTVNLATDAGLSYIYKKETSVDNLVLSKEEVWEQAIHSKYWIIIASRPKKFSLKDLLKEEDIYKEFEAVKNGNVIFCNTSFTDYFTRGPVQPELMLQDLINCINKNDTSTTYFKILK